MDKANQYVFYKTVQHLRRIKIIKYCSKTLYFHKAGKTCQIITYLRYQTHSPSSLLLKEPQAKPYIKR
jgi:hypothetical protein